MDSDTTLPVAAGTAAPPTSDPEVKVAPPTSDPDVKVAPPPAGGTSAASMASPPIKLRIRRSFQQEHMIVSEGGEAPAPAPPPALPPQPPPKAAGAGAGVGEPVVGGASPAGRAQGAAPAAGARFGRTKTKQDIMQQLMEKKRGRKLLGGSTGDGTPPPQPVAAAQQPQQQDELPVENSSEKPVKWMVGDLMWAKVSGHPWWPCMVAFDPFQGVYTKIKGGASSRVSRRYHVQFFGDAVERGWVSEMAMLPFEGRAAFDAHCVAMTTLHPKDRDRYRVRPNRRRAWDVAVGAIEAARGLTRTERRQRYTFVYEAPAPAAPPAEPRTRGRKPKRKAEDGGAAAGGARSPAAKRAKAAEAAVAAMTAYEAFCAGRRDELAVAHPVDSERKLDQRLEALWRGMGDDERAEFTDGTQTKLPDVVQRSGRVSRPSQKKLEADEDSVEVQKIRKSLCSPRREDDDAHFDPPAEPPPPPPAPEVNGPKRERGRPRKKPLVDAGSTNVTDKLQQKPAEVVDRRTKPGRKRSVAEGDGGDAAPAANVKSAEKAAEVVDRRMKTGRKKSVAEGDGGDAAPAANVKSAEKAAEVVDRRMKPGRKKSVAEGDGGDAAPAANVKSAEKPAEVVDRRMKTMRKKSVAEGDGACDGSEAAAPSVKKTEVAERPMKTEKRKKSAAEVNAGSAESESVDSASKNEDQPAAAAVAPPAGGGGMTLEISRLSSAGPSRREDVCALCERPAEATSPIVTCAGECASTYHASCLGLTTRGPSFTCDECVTGCHMCFACKKSSLDTRRCAAPLCGRFYHPTCLSNLPLARPDNNNHYYCPLHTCATCVLNGPKNPKASKGRMSKCVRCPTAYHVGDLCVAAGSESLAGFNIVCSAHFAANKAHAHHSHVNVNWCFICSRGGSLLCCEACPAAFHPECLGLSSPPDGSWHCKECQSGRRPLYGNIVWVKVGNYRWWPGEICHKRNVPQNIQEKPHSVGEFPVHFFGSNDYFWTHQARLFLFQEGDKGSRDTTTAKGLAKLFHRAVREATEAFKLWTQSKAKKEEQQQERGDRKPAAYKHIKTNLPVGTVQICRADVSETNLPVGTVQICRADVSEVPRCECAGDGATCYSDTDCMNRMLFYECHAAACAGADRCHNQRFQRREYPPTRVIRVEGRGWGLHTLVDIRQGQFVNEYVGDLVDEEECKRRIIQAHTDNISNFYMLTLDKNRIIDAGPKGNYSRFMNHSCEPNCETQKWMVNGDIRVGLFAICDVVAGSELTFNYNLDCLGNEKKACRCEAPNCSGFLGVRPKTAAAAENEKRARDAKARRKKKKITERGKDHEDECFRCGEGGEVVMCDRAHCCKVYHVTCLKLSRPPTGKWLCPWHHCDECGAPARLLCSRCPNSYCSLHAPAAMTTQPDSQMVCEDHAASSDGENTASSTTPSDDDRATAPCKLNGGVRGGTLKDNAPAAATETNGKAAAAVATSSGRRASKQSRSDTDSPMFDDDDDDDEFPELVIDIPTV